MGARSAAQRVFSRPVVVTLFVVLVLLLGASFHSYRQDQELQSVSLAELRMASWNLAQLGHEADEFGHELRAMTTVAADQDQLLLQYDILWSRYDYLLQSRESAPTRNHSDNESRLRSLFSQLRAMETPLMALVSGQRADWDTLTTQWQPQRVALQQLVVDNFVGDETGQLMDQVQASRERLSLLSVLTLVVVAVILGYLAFALIYIRRQSRIDQQTGLPNANYLQVLRSVDVGQAIIACDIRDYRVVLSEYGTDYAADLTHTFIDRLRVGLELYSFQLVQLSPSEFVIFVHTGDTGQLVRQLLASVHFDWMVHDAVLPVRGIFGIDPAGAGPTVDWQDRYQQAQRCLAQAERQGLDHCINNQDLRKQLMEERLVHAGLVRFLADEPSSLSLSLMYQPIVSTGDIKDIRGAEVLLRAWQEELGPVPPNRVVELCERFGLGRQLGRWLFRQIAMETRQLYTDLGFQGTLSINLNPAMLADELETDVRSLLLDAGIPASCLCLEITEDNAALNFGRINELIQRLSQAGVGFALDDFGTGHSSLEYVRELKIDRLKIDRCFVQGIEHSAGKARFLGSIIAMAEQGFLKSVVEGVENEAQWNLVRAMGGSLVQGFFAYKPLLFSDFVAEILKHWSTVSSDHTLEVSS